MYEHVKTGCKHIPPSEQPLQFQSGYYLNKPRRGNDINALKFRKAQTLHFAHTAYLCVKAESHNKQRLFPYIMLQISLHDGDSFV